jgi:hypothetical protein
LKFTECVLPFCSESFVFPLAIGKRNVETYTPIVLRVVLCEVETLSVTLKEERRMRVFQFRVMRRIFGAELE